MILHHEFIRAAKKFGKKIAVIDRTTGQSYTYERALIAVFILMKKIKKYPETNLGIMIPTSFGAILAVIATLFLRRVPVMINYSTGAEQNAKYAQEKANFKTIITSRALLEKIKCPLVPGMICVEDILKSVTLFDKIGALLKTKKSAEALIKGLPKADPEDTVVILFTSGSEKDPKGVMLCHRNVGSNLDDAKKVLPISSDDRLISMLPLFHVFGYTVDLWLPLHMGMSAVTYANPLEYKKIASIIRNDKPTVMASTPAFYAGYLREAQKGDFASLRITVPGADKAPEWLRKAYKEQQNIDLLEGYGCTETSPIISVNTPDFKKPGSIGKPLPSVQVKITDPDTGVELARGKEGKILVKGDLVMKGYLDPEETAKAIKNGWYDTGDMGLMDEDGYLWHKGRYKRFIKIGGEMVSLVNTEVVLEGILSGKAECCIVHVEDPVKGARIVAAVSDKIDEDAVLKALTHELPPIAVPKIFVVLPEIPKMSSGKPDFRTVTKIVQDMLAKERI
ncbi:MAG: bifunctional acyl-ACP--phospholipid O-acyltransferase/long-chain-fatty-acid--ACP ligase [Spirochaetaceae bacterium]|nr:MAG: bifunctional acyl-ACP--phospholipid O-acyltransferase/long-chain-fatty-acid--ACP ligase [Spirochaetaceae bacterium]